MSKHIGEHVTNHVIKAGLDTAAIMNVVAAVVGWLPAIAALLTVLYYAFVLWDVPAFVRFRSRVKGWFGGQQPPPQSPSGAGQEPSKPA